MKFSTGILAALGIGLNLFAVLTIENPIMRATSCVLLALSIIATANLFVRETVANR